MQSRGRIKEIDGDIVTVYVVREGSCGANCAACKGCENRAIEVNAICNFNVKPGDIVEVYTPTSSVIFALLIVYLFPVIFPLIVYFLTFKLGALIACVSAAAAFVCSLYLPFRLSRSEKYLKKLKATVTKVLHEK